MHGMHSIKTSGRMQFIVCYLIIIKNEKHRLKMNITIFIIIDCLVQNDNKIKNIIRIRSVLENTMNKSIEIFS